MSQILKVGFPEGGLRSWRIRIKGLDPRSPKQLCFLFYFIKAIEGLGINVL